MTVKTKSMKRVESFYCTRYPNGTYCLIFNTAERWENVHRANDTTYIFGPDHDEEVIELDEFLPTISDGLYISSEMQDKDQVSFFFMPFRNEEVSAIEEVLVRLKNPGKNETEIRGIPHQARSVAP